MGTCSGPSLPRRMSSPPSGKRDNKRFSRVREAESEAVSVSDRKRGSSGAVRHLRRPWWRMACVEFALEDREGVLSLMPAHVTSSISGSTCGVILCCLRSLNVRCCSSETLAGGGVMGIGGNS